MPRKSVGALALGALVLSCLAVTPPATAATYTSTGVRCTITGTPGPDHLTGSAGRDVICGLGGNDVINGVGGNDLIDAGAGADTVNGGTGSDVLRGGPGPDHLTGSDGADTVTGGDGGDVITGGSGGDDLNGSSGNDDLTGGPGVDDINGNGGTNWCTVGATDTETGCKYDLQKAASSDATFSTDRVDVSNGDQQVTVRVHVTDDTGVSEVGVSGSDDASGDSVGSGRGDLVEGSVRDGWWEATFVIPRWSAPGGFTLDVALRDRVGRQSSQEYPDQVLQVVDRNPDVDLPQVSLVSPAASASYDVTSGGQDVVVKARITDAVSGVWYADLCLWKPQESSFTNLPCQGGDLVSGDSHDGVWRAVVRIPKGDVGGDWNVGVDTVDRAHKDSSPVQWMGPDLYRYWTDDGQNTDAWSQPLPGGRGRFSVIGKSDSVAPQIESFALTPDHVDTLEGPASVTFTVHAVDGDGGISDVGLALNPVNDPDNDLFAPVDLTLTSGDDSDGTWTGTLTLPQGSPPETYTFQVWVQDVSHFRSYVSASSPYAGDADQQLLAGDPKLVVGSGGGPG